MSRKAGAMLVGGSIAMLAMATGGALMANYGWREAQEAEIEAALRAGVAAAAHFMRGDLAAAEDKIKERVAGVMRGLMDDLIVGADDIIVQHDLATNRTIITVAGGATYLFKSLWAAGGTGAPEPVDVRVVVEFDTSQFEFALALDVSRSMGRTPPGWSVTRLDALKDTIRAVAQTVDTVSTTNPGVVTLALVPYSNVVNVADTSGIFQTEAKERYVRMLTGAEYSTQASRDSEGHWVDTFHYYGTGADMGPLSSRDLPDFLTVTDWDLHQPGADDVSSQVPDLGTWDFEGSDFWNGCVMARWGAYWDPDARPVVWDPGDLSNWPARKTVAGWEPGSTGIQGLPLHLSDEPPDAADPNTRFSAYSWPDARIAGTADSHLSEVMRMALDSSYSSPALVSVSENHWHLRAQDRGGSLLCPDAPIVPLTDDITSLQAANDYEPVASHSRTFVGQTFLHLGIVWGLRALSPLWKDVWRVKSVSGEDLPRTPCAEGGTVQGCSQSVEKAIVIVSDGANWLGDARRGRSFERRPRGLVHLTNPIFGLGRCDASFRTDAIFRTAISAEDPATFSAGFSVDSSGVFTPAGLSAVLDGFQHLHPLLATLNPLVPADQLVINSYRMVWENALKDMTPWQLFRGYDDNSPTKSADAADVLTDPANVFGLEGRPVHSGHYCRPITAAFSAYGRADDLVRVGDGPPVADVAPLSVPSWPWSDSTGDLRPPLEDRLDDWFREACDLAGQRGVRIHAIYIGGDRQPWEQAAIALLEECVDRGYGSSPAVDEVHVAPTAQELQDAIENIIDIRRTLRFIDP
ncbi:MAG: hypothetical protein OXI90_16325 [Gammaproteobacteria bacterium]|nr:hypothetical protein [Gammaproteobacteria bacterium]